MRRGLFIAGVVVLVLGLLIFVGDYAYISQPSTVTVGGGSVDELTPSGVGATQLSVSWSGGSSNTEVYLTTSTPSCPNSGSNVATGSGASGSFSASLASGSTYGLYFCTGGAVSSSSSISVTTTATGFTWFMVIGIAIAVIGAIIAVLGYRAEPKARPVEEEAPAEGMVGLMGAPTPYAVPPPMTPETSSSGGPGTEKTVIGDRIPPPEPPRFMPASEPEEPSATSGPAPSGAARPNRTCAKCGTVNEPWVTNCRKCKRPLASTGTS
jgi:hypothetical protein